MKSILQAAALILLTASVVYAAAHSSVIKSGKCNSEWDKMYEESATVMKSEGDLKKITRVKTGK
jgi:hypothetical protein